MTVPVLYYGTSETLRHGDAIICQETEASQEFFICHPDDLDEIKEKLSLTRQLVHIKDQSYIDYLVVLQKRLYGEKPDK